MEEKARGVPPTKKVRVVVNDFGPLTEGEFTLGDRVTVFTGPQASGKGLSAKLAYASTLAVDAVLLAFRECLSPGELTVKTVPTFKDFVSQVGDLVRAEFLSGLPGLVARSDETRVAVEYGGCEAFAFKGRAWKTELSEEFKAAVDDWHKLFALADEPDVAMDLVTEAVWEYFGTPRDTGLLTGDRTLTLGPDSLNDEESGFLNHLTAPDAFRGQRKSFVPGESLRSRRRVPEANPVLDEKVRSLLGSQELVDVVENRDWRTARGSQGQLFLLRLLTVTQTYLTAGQSLHLVLEYPEAFLYPDTQRALVEYLALWCADVPGNRCTLTTHSPYVLGALNNLADAGLRLRDGENANAVLEVLRKYGIAPEQCLAPGELAAYFIDDGKVVDAVDEENGLIRNELIDGASNVINGLADELLYL